MSWKVIEYDPLLIKVKLRCEMITVLHKTHKFANLMHLALDYVSAYMDFPA
jgi:hypothetical protein